MTVAFAPGRVNVIGDHTDYTGGLCLPMAIQLGTTVEGEPGGPDVRLTSSLEREPAVVPLGVEHPAAVRPGWARYVAGVVAEVRPDTGFVGHVSTDLPAGAGLSSSAALEVAVALALGFEGGVLELAQRCRRAEHRATGVPCGIMDQLASAAGVDRHLLRIDCRDEEVSPLPVPAGVEIVAVDSRQPRTLAGSAYGNRRDECRRAESAIGPLRDATIDDLRRIGDPVIRRRARHVLTENERVDAFVGALAAGDLAGAGALMGESHRSLSIDFEVSTPEVDALVATLAGTPGVLGARMTGGGFGGTVVVLVEQGAALDGMRLVPSGGASVAP
jgi:galactokinase